MSASSSRQPVLLLVDDEKEFGAALSFRLTTRGLSCLFVESGEEALTLLETPGLEVVLLDVNMPGLGGIETLIAIKQKRPELEVVLLTGEANLETAARGMRRGAGDYLLKPVNFEKLIFSLERARQRAAAHTERLRAVQAGHLLALGTMAAGLAHEMNNPLHIITQGAEWLEELAKECQQGTCNTAALQKTAGQVKHNAMRCGNLVAQLLHLATRSKHRQGQTHAPQLLHKMAALWQEPLNSLGAQLVVDCPETLPPVPCTAVELEPVLVHLGKNALDALENRKEQEAGQNGPPLVLRLHAREHDGVLHIEIADTGEGIAPSVLPHIYEPFFSTRPVGKGAGLGLTMCHSIVSALRGRISHSQQEGGGTVCLLELPVELQATE